MGSSLTLESAVKSVNSIDLKGNTSLMRACKKKKETLALNILKKSKELKLEIDLNVKNHKGETALIIACKNKLSKIALALVDQDTIDIDIQDSNLTTALMWACHENMYEVVDIMLEKKADASKLNSFGKSALTFLLKKSITKDLTELILKLVTVANMYNVNKGLKDPYLLYDIIQNSWYIYDDLIVKLIKMGVPYDKKLHTVVDEKETIIVDSVLELACYKGYIATVKKIMELEGIYKFVSSEGQKLLKLAVRGRSGRQMLFHLLDSDAKLDDHVYNNFIELLYFSKGYGNDHYVLEYINLKHPQRLNAICAAVEIKLKKDRDELFKAILHDYGGSGTEGMLL